MGVRTAKTAKSTASCKVKKFQDGKNQGNGFKAEGGVNLVGANIDGDLDCHGGEFINKGGKPAQGDGIRPVEPAPYKIIRSIQQVRYARICPFCRKARGKIRKLRTTEACLEDKTDQPQ
jgi:hypothetical protein